MTQGLNTNIQNKAVKLREHDPKRYFWPLSPLSLTLPVLSIWAYFISGANTLFCLATVIFLFVFIPILDALIGEDPYNLSPQAEIQMENDPYYKAIIWATIPLYYISLIATIWFVSTQPLPLWAQIGAVLGAAFMNGSANNVGHELGHKASKFDQFGALLALSSIGNGHFNAEHNLNHHSKVATPADPSSARLGESLYHFARRDIIGAIKGAWHLEKRRLKVKGYKFISLHNKLLLSWGGTALLTLILTLWLGWIALPFIFLHHFTALFTLSLANYVEHYGLLRARKDTGRYEPCAPRHSWNTNHIASNILTLHLQRHSDHHANPARPYQILRNFDDLPSLPSGYPGSFGLALIPPIWFAVMDKKVLAWAEGDLSKANICPKAEAKLTRKWG